MPRHVVKGDLVYIRSGDDRGKTGKILQVLPESEKVIVEGMNVRKKHMKRTEQQQQGGIVEKEMPIHISNVSPIADGKPTRVRFEKREDGSKVRIAASNGQVLSELRKARK